MYTPHALSQIVRETSLPKQSSCCARPALVSAHPGIREKLTLRMTASGALNSSGRSVSSLKTSVSLYA